MNEYYIMAARLIPAWLLTIMAVVAAIEMLVLSVYLIRSSDHLIMNAADIGLMGAFMAFVAVHYFLIYAAPNYARSVAMSRLAWGMFLFVNVIIMTRYLLVVYRTRLKVSTDAPC